VESSPESDGENTTWTPPGPVGDPDPEAWTHGDPAYIMDITYPRYGDCVSTYSFRHLTGGVSSAGGMAARRKLVSGFIYEFERAARTRASFSARTRFTQIPLTTHTSHDSLR
jgi:hypothetical protein